MEKPKLIIEDNTGLPAESGAKLKEVIHNIDWNAYLPQGVLTITIRVKDGKPYLMETEPKRKVKIE